MVQPIPAVVAKPITSLPMNDRRRTPEAAVMAVRIVTRGGMLVELVSILVGYELGIRAYGGYLILRLLLLELDITIR